MPHEEFMRRNSEPQPLPAIFNCKSGTRKTSPVLAFLLSGLHSKLTIGFESMRRCVFFRAARSVWSTGMQRISLLLGGLIVRPRVDLVALALVAAVLALSTVSADEQKRIVSRPTKPFSIIIKAFIPLRVNDTTPIVVEEVPVMAHSDEFEQTAIAHALSSPFYARSGEPSDRDRDVNIISLSGISLQFHCLGGIDRAFELLIDVTNAKIPDYVQCDIPDIVNYAIMCIRLSIPPRREVSVKIKIIGGQTDPRLRRLEGEMWTWQNPPAVKE